MNHPLPAKLRGIDTGNGTLMDATAAKINEVISYLEERDVDPVIKAWKERHPERFGDARCCKECFLPSIDSTGEDYRGALPEGCKDEDCPCHAPTPHSSDWETQFDSRFACSYSPTDWTTDSHTLGEVKTFIKSLLSSKEAETLEKARAEQIKDLRWLARNLEDMYGRLGVGAVYDSIRDHADELEKELSDLNK